MTEAPRPHSSSWWLITGSLLLFVGVIAFIPLVTCPTCKGTGVWVFGHGSSGAAIGCARRVSFWSWWNDRAGTRNHQQIWFFSR